MIVVVGGIISLYGCGGTRIEYIEDCDVLGKKVYFTEQMGYLTTVKKNTVDPLTYEIGRALYIFVFDNGKKNSDIEAFSLHSASIGTNEKKFTITACYNAVHYGYEAWFAGTTAGYVLESEKGVKSTSISSLVEDKHWVK